MSDDDTCANCGHPEHFHTMPHQHAPYTEMCPFGCCVVDAEHCDTFESVANAAERQWEHKQRAMAND